MDVLRRLMWKQPRRLEMEIVKAAKAGAKFRVGVMPLARAKKDSPGLSRTFRTENWRHDEKYKINPYSLSLSFFDFSENSRMDFIPHQIHQKRIHHL